MVRLRLRATPVLLRNAQNQLVNLRLQALTNQLRLKLTRHEVTKAQIHANAARLRLRVGVVANADKIQLNILN